MALFPKDIRYRRKDNQALIDLLNEGIEKVKASGEAAKISEKWFGKDVILK